MIVIESVKESADGARQRMVGGAAAALGRGGLRAASFSRVIADTGAPRGSIYHHFPRGKRQLVQEALELAEALALRALAEPRTEPEQVVRAFAAPWRQLLERSDLRAGCAVAAVAAEADDDDDLRDVAGLVFAHWIDALAPALEAAGLSQGRGRPVATLVLAGIEGALLLARARRDFEPFDLTVEELATHVAADG